MTTVASNDGETCARYVGDGQPVRVRWHEGRITEWEPTTAPVEETRWIAPPLVDLQVNGFGGVDFQQDDLTLDQLLSATRQLRASGCGRYLLTLITDEWPRLMSRLRRARHLRSQSAELQSAIAGWHVEGPFLSSEPGFCGAHDPALMLDPTPAHIEQLRALTESDPLLVTLAPERPGALEAIALAASLGVKVSLGHTNATAEVLHQAIQAGASAFTHLGNGCPRDLDRHDNILWRVLETEGLMTSLIPDRIHVSPALFRLVHWVLGPESILYTTDAMAAAGAPPGRYRLRGLELEVGPDQIVRQPGKTNFAGSALRPIDGVFRAAAMLRASWLEVWPRFCSQPARFMGLTSGLQAGADASFCLLRMAGPNELGKLHIYWRGEQTM